MPTDAGLFLLLVYMMNASVLELNLFNYLQTLIQVGEGASVYSSQYFIYCAFFFFMCEQVTWGCFASVQSVRSGGQAEWG